MATMKIGMTTCSHVPPYVAWAVNPWSAPIQSLTKYDALNASSVMLMTQARATLEMNTMYGITIMLKTQGSVDVSCGNATRATASPIGIHGTRCWRTAGK